MKNEAPRTALKKKLTLNKETIRILTEKEMVNVEGGAGTFRCATSGCYPSSPPATCPPA